MKLNARSLLNSYTKLLYLVTNVFAQIIWCNYQIQPAWMAKLQHNVEVQTTGNVTIYSTCITRKHNWICNEKEALRKLGILSVHIASYNSQQILIHLPPIFKIVAGQFSVFFFRSFGHLTTTSSPMSSWLELSSIDDLSMTDTDLSENSTRTNDIVLHSHWNMQDKVKE